MYKKISAILKRLQREAPYGEEKFLPTTKVVVFLGGSGRAVDFMET